MLAVQEYLKTKSFEDLTSELGIIVKKHDTLPIAIVNYDQISSPRSHPVTRECRGLVLHTEDKSVVARSFPRFFNVGEMVEEMELFDFSDFIVQEKVDGSLVLLFYFDGQWHGNTRGSFALDKMGRGIDLTWREGFCKAMGISDLQELDRHLDRSITYICEFCSSWNKVVRRYEKPTMYLLTAFTGLEEIHHDKIGAYDLFRMPERYHFHGIEEIKDFLVKQSISDPTFEGVVIKDRHGHRWKVKSSTYLAFHAMRGEGDNLYHPKNLLPFILSGEEQELLVYFPEVTDTFIKLKARVNEDYERLVELWQDHKDVVVQKDFALAIKDRTPYTAFLFNVRKKYGPAATPDDLRKEWSGFGTQILKVIA